MMEAVLPVCAPCFEGVTSWERFSGKPCNGKGASRNGQAGMSLIVSSLWWFVLLQVVDERFSPDVLSTVKEMNVANFRRVPKMPVYGTAQPNSKVSRALGKWEGDQGTGLKPSSFYTLCSAV